MVKIWQKKLFFWLYQRVIHKLRGPFFVNFVIPTSILGPFFIVHPTVNGRGRWNAPLTSQMGMFFMSFMPLTLKMPIFNKNCHRTRTVECSPLRGYMVYE